jgi:hypothetical protein
MGQNHLMSNWHCIFMGLDRKVTKSFVDVIQVKSLLAIQFEATIYYFLFKKEGINKHRFTTNNRVYLYRKMFNFYYLLFQFSMSYC